MTQMANACVGAAKTVASLLPVHSDASHIYENGPWWSIVHHLMQSVSVLLLALTQSPGKQDNLELVQCTRDIIRWLGMMQDPQAERACQMAIGTLEVVAKRLRIDVSDLRVGDGVVPGNFETRYAYAPSFTVPLDPSLETPYAQAPLAAVVGSSFPMVNGWGGPFGNPSYVPQEGEGYYGQG